jgi:hypothetical protein
VCLQVFYFQRMEVNDFRNDIILAEACRTDVETYCKDVEPGACVWVWVRVWVWGCYEQVQKWHVVEVLQARLPCGTCCLSSSSSSSSSSSRIHENSGSDHCES